ncbi:MAG: hypothetical protein M1816_003930 [Peltula sp. TS41687]|nr:MAG: hypothetical protein M1816_003930 [Peltula sp. TS41687]
MYTNSIAFQLDHHITHTFGFDSFAVGYGDTDVVDWFQAHENGPYNGPATGSQYNRPPVRNPETFMCYKCGRQGLMAYNCTAPPLLPQEQEDVQRKVDADIATRRARNVARAAPAAAVEIQDAWRATELHPAGHTWVTEITPEQEPGNGGASNMAHVCMVEEVYAAGGRRTRSEAGLDDLTAPNGPSGRPTKKPRESGPQGGKNPKGSTPAAPLQIRMMKNLGVFDPIEALRKTEVKGLDWGGFLELAPRAQIAVMRSLVRERPKRPSNVEIVGSIPAGPVTTALAILRCEIFYTEILVTVQDNTRPASPNRLFRVTEVLVDAGAMVNCISSQTAEALSLELVRDTDVTICNAEGGLQHLLHSVTCPFVISTVPTITKAYVVKGSAPYSVLLGRPWMKQTAKEVDSKYFELALEDVYNEESTTK